MDWLNEPSNNCINDNARGCGANVCWARESNSNCQADYCVVRLCITRFCWQNWST